jgi:hypothetical protein
MHVGAVSLHVQERAVEPGEPVLTHSGIFAQALMPAQARPDSALEWGLHTILRMPPM